MATNATTGTGSQENGNIQADLLASLSQSLGQQSPKQRLLDQAFYDGLEPVLESLGEGALNQEQASLLIKLLLSAYVGATVNLQIEGALQSGADRITGMGLGEPSGRR